MFKKLSFVFLFLLSTLSIANAAESEALLLGKFKNWSVYKGPKDVVFMATRATKQSGTYSKRDNPYFMVSCFDKDSIEISIFTGYTYKSGSDVALKIFMSNKGDSKTETIKLFPQGERAWLRGDQDKAIIEKLKAASKVSVSGQSFRGTASVDEYSLEGFTEAYHKMMSAKAGTVVA